VAEQIAGIVIDGYLTAVEDDSAPQLGGNLGIDGYGFTSSFVADENLAVGDLCYLTAGGTMARTSALQSNTCRTLLGVSTTSLLSGTSGSFLLKGFFTTTQTLTPGEVLYVGVNTGMWQEARPFGDGDVVRPIGYSVAASQLFFDPDKTWLGMESQ
jgi:hypothetical protein